MDDHAEFFWERLLQAIESGKLVPVVGRDALLIETTDGQRRLDQLVAERLAPSFGIASEDLPPGYDINDVICRAGGFRGITSTPTTTRIISILQSLKVAMPETLRLLASISKLRLFVSLTFDTLLENAITEVRGRPPAVASFPVSTEHADFDPALLDSHGAMVFHLLGRRSASAQFAVTEGQTLEFLHKVMASSQRPQRLIERLQDSHLLMLGLGLPDWPSRFLVRLARQGPLWNDRDTDEIVAQGSLDGLPTFLHRFSPEHSLTLPLSPLEFARELHRRWFERFPERATAVAIEQADAEGPEKPPAEMLGGSIFISYAREDRDAAFRFADQLNDAEVDVWVDRRLNPGENYRRAIERNIQGAAGFIPVLSSNTNGFEPRWYRREWQLACKQNEIYFGTGANFIFPVIVDGSSARDHQDSLSLFGSQASRVSSEGPDPALVQFLKQAQRAWRRRHAVHV